MRKANEVENMSSGNGNLPEKKFSTGAITATIWKNNGVSKQTGEGTEYNTISLQRSYKDKDGKWQSTTSLRVNDLPKASLVLHKAYEYLVLRERDSDVPIEEV
jgi:hypothetical protein